MIAVGSVFPEFFQRLYNVLAAALLTAIIIELIQVFVLHLAPKWIDWIFVIIFCGYIGYDWGRANRIPKTVDDAVDSAALVYVDIVNLFVWLLTARSRRRQV